MARSKNNAALFSGREACLRRRGTCLVTGHGNCYTKPFSSRWLNKGLREPLGQFFGKEHLLQKHRQFRTQ